MEGLGHEFGLFFMSFDFFGCSVSEVLKRVPVNVVSIQCRSIYLSLHHIGTFFGILPQELTIIH